MKRIITTLIALTLVVACFCVPLVASAEYVSGAEQEPVSPTVVSSIYDYGLTFGYFDDAQGVFVDWAVVSTYEFNLSDYAYNSEDVSTSVYSPTGEMDIDLMYYASDPYHVWTVPLWQLMENDPDLTSVYSWRFDTPFVLPETLTSNNTPIADCSFPNEGDPSVDAYVSYSYDYYDGVSWVHKAYLLPLDYIGDGTVLLFPERAESRLLRNLVTTIVFEDGLSDDRFVGVNRYGMPFFVGNKASNSNYVDPVTYAIGQYGVIDGSQITWTGFIGNALGGVFDAPLFKIDTFEFTLGGLLGVCIGMGVLMLVLKKFAGG